jgi:hypothetical protein
MNVRTPDVLIVNMEPEKKFLGNTTQLNNRELPALQVVRV